jgi:hypothetical protein
MSRRSKERERILDDFELDKYGVNISRILKKNSKNLQKLKEAKRGRSRTYRLRMQGRFIFRKGHHGSSRNVSSDNG